MTNKKEPATEMHVRLYYVSFPDGLHRGLARGIRDIAFCWIQCMCTPRGSVAPAKNIPSKFGTSSELYAFSELTSQYRTRATYGSVCDTSTRKGKLLFVVVCDTQEKMTCYAC